MQGIDLLPKLCCIFAVDILRKLPFLFTGEVCHPSQVIQYDGVQFFLSDVVGSAFSLAALAVGVALEIVIRLFHRACSVQYHRPSAVGAVGESRKDIRLCHLLWCAFLVRAYILNDIPLLLCDQRGMRIFHNGAFAFGAVYRCFVFIRYRRGTQSNGVSEVHLVVKDTRHGTAPPCIRTGGVQSEMPFLVLLEVIIAGC